MRLSIALAQANPTVGDIAGNLAIVRRMRNDAAARGADLVVFSELVLIGYPPEDLVLRPAFVDAAASALDELIAESAQGGPGLVVTLPWRDAHGDLHNAVAVVADGTVELRYKHELPNYGVFDEMRVFLPGDLPEPIAFRGARLGIPICEDIWFPHVTAHLKRRGAELLLVPNGSPFEVDKFDRRLVLAGQRVAECGLPLAYVNQVGGQDELVFDGGSFVIDTNGRVAHVSPFWRETLTLTCWERVHGRFTCHSGSDASGSAFTPEPRASAVYHAMMLGLRDYVDKNRFPGVVIGLSGGIDSALTAVVAVDALGPQRVRGVRLPSRFTSEATLFAGRPRDVAEENVQARIRGVLLMAVSNKFGEMLVTTGNKSEMSVGYSTLYGDMCGGYAVLKDVYKTEVYALAHWRNAHHPVGALGPEGLVIPESSITKAPTAELRPNQTDQDSLPPYAELDAILTGLIEDEASVSDIVDRGFARETVLRVQRMLFTAEYKRRQAPPGVKITRKSFGRDRRYPLTNAFREDSLS